CARKPKTSVLILQRVSIVQLNNKAWNRHNKTVSDLHSRWGVKLSCNRSARPPLRDCAAAKKQQRRHGDGDDEEAVMREGRIHECPQDHAKDNRGGPHGGTLRPDIGGLEYPAQNSPA